MIEEIHFFVPGIPKGQPRARARVQKMGKRLVPLIYSDNSADDWKTAVGWAARAYLPKRIPPGVPIALALTFYFPRPESHYRAGRFSDHVKDSAPLYHITKPDFDNAAKLIMDVLVKVGLIADDCQICQTPGISKLYSRTPKEAGCEIVISSPQNTLQQLLPSI